MECHCHTCDFLLLVCIVVPGIEKQSAVWYFSRFHFHPTLSIGMGKSRSIAYRMEWIRFSLITLSSCYSMDWYTPCRRLVFKKPRELAFLFKMVYPFGNRVFSYDCGNWILSYDIGNRCKRIW